MLGPYERKVPESNSIKRDRLRFLCLTSTFYPETMHELVKKSYPLHLEFSTTQLRDQAAKGIGFITPLTWERIEKAVAADALRESLREWAEGTQLNAEWCCQWAVRAMEAWASDKEARDTLSWFKSPLVVASILFPELGFIPPHWDHENLRQTEHLLCQLGVLDFGRDDEPRSHGDIDWDGIGLQPVQLGMMAYGKAVWDEKKQMPLPVYTREYLELLKQLPPEAPDGKPPWRHTSISSKEYLEDVERRVRQQQQELAGLRKLRAEDSHHKAIQEAEAKQIKKEAADFCRRVADYYEKGEGLKNWQLARPIRNLKYLIWAVRCRRPGKVTQAQIADEYAAIDPEGRVTPQFISKEVSVVYKRIGLSQLKRGRKPQTQPSSGIR